MHGAGADLRVAVVGVGARARIARHLPEVRPGSAVVAAVDPDPAGIARARAWFGDVAVHAGLPELIAAGGVDAAIVSTPDDTHADLAVDLLRAGIAVYLEKPLATSVADADRVLAAAVETGTPLHVGHNYRHADVVRVMRGVLDRGEIGQVKAVWVRHFVGHGGDFYFKDWHADRRRTGSLLLQKASHDIDIVHLLASGTTSRVVGMGDLMVYGDVTDRRERTGETMPDWLSLDNWPPGAQTGLHPVIDVEDVSMMLMTLDNGVQASYQQCHFTPDYWRNYTVIGTHGRMENVGDTAGGVVRVWNRRRDWSIEGDLEYRIGGVGSGHADADASIMAEFAAHLADGAPLSVTPVAARAAVAAGALAAESLRDRSRPRVVPPLPDDVLSYFATFEAPTDARPSTGPAGEPGR